MSAHAHAPTTAVQQSHTLNPSTACTPPCMCREEKNCRFCNGALPDYRKALTKDRAGAAPGGRPPLPTAQRVPNMRVHYGNVTVVMPLMPGEAGKRDFEAGVRKVLKLPADKVSMQGGWTHAHHRPAAEAWEEVPQAAQCCLVATQQAIC